METPANKQTDDDEGPGPDSESPDAAALSLPALLGRFLLLFLLGLVALLLVSLLVVYVTGLAARRFGLPELPVLLTVLGLLAILVIALAGGHIAGQILRLGRTLESTIEDAGERIAVEVNESTEDLAERLGEVPVLMVEPPKGASPGGKPAGRSRR